MVEDCTESSHQLHVPIRKILCNSQFLEFRYFTIKRLVWTYPRGMGELNHFLRNQFL
jgi:hypothetical protein